jgi:hypothetical protein
MFGNVDLSEEEDKTIAGFVIIDKIGEEEEPSLAKLYIWSFFCRPWHLFKLTLMLIPICVMFKYLIDWNDIISLYVEFLLLLIQLVFTIDKIPGMRLNTQSYLSGATIRATLEETRTRSRRFMFKGPKKTHYVVLYMTTGGDGRPMAIRKTLQAGVFDDDLPNDEATSHRNVLTDLVCREGAPFSAFPRSAVWKHHLRYRQWMLYFMPILVVTCIVIAYNLYCTLTVEWGRIHHIQLLTPLGIIYGALYAVVLIPTIYKVRRWKYDVSYGGDEITQFLN